MFYDKVLMIDSVMQVPWRVAYDQKPTKEVPLLKLCTTFERWMDVDTRTFKPLSLRSEAIFLNGVVKLYSEEINKLFDDCAQTFQEIMETNLTTEKECEQAIVNNDENTTSDTYGGSNVGSNDDSDEVSKSGSNGGSNEGSDDSSYDNTDVEQESNRSSEATPASNSPRKSDEPSRKRKTIEDFDKNSKDYQSKKRNLENANDVNRTAQSNEPTVGGARTSRQQSIGTNEQRQATSELATDDKETQTDKSYIRNAKERDKYRQWNLNEDSPMGFAMVFNRNFRPTSVIFSNINAAVKRL